MNEIEYHYFWNTDFEIKLWSEVSELLEKGKEEKALLILFGGIHDELKNVHNVNNLLILLMTKDLTSDIIVHTLNAASPIKERLSIWDDFVRFSKNELTRLVGEKDMNVLLNVIV